MGAVFSICLIYVFFLVSLQHQLSSAQQACPASYCSESGPSVRFPFRLRRNQTRRCGYPGFDLSCDRRGETVLNLPASGDFLVREINYAAQTVWLADPEGCLPKRFRNFSVSGSPFQADAYQNYTFLNCSSLESAAIPYRKVGCLSGANYTVVATREPYYEAIDNNATAATTCVFMSTVVVPVSWLIWSDFNNVIQLTWSEPPCGWCEMQSQSCGFKTETGVETQCIDPSSAKGGSGLPRSAKYGLIIGVGVPGVLCLFGLSGYICSKIKRCAGRRGRPDMEIEASVVPQASGSVRGLDGSTIESYPKTLLGASRRLARPEDNVCAICLSEYQAKETLRTIPECSHYFHANCIDEWLKVNVTCPMCRKSPEESSREPHSSTPFSSSSSSSNSLSPS